MKLNRNRLSMGVAVSALLSGMTAFPALAEESRGLVVEEIVVTAQKREQSSQDVGISMTAIDGDTLQSLGAESSADVALMTPNFNIQSITGEGNQPAFFIRGVGLNDYNTNNAGPVAVYRDGVIVSSPSAQIFAMYDTDRVEVLRGPQGTLYGRNATGGTVNFITRKPTETLDGFVTLNVGNYDRVNVEGAIGGPISDQLRGRLAFVTNNADGYIKDTESGTRYGETGNQGLRGMLDWTPSDRVSVLATLHWGENDTIRPTYKHFGTFDALTFSRCADLDITRQSPDCVSALGYQDTNSDIHEGAWNREGKLKFDTWGGALEIGWDINDSVTFTSITGYDELDKSDAEDSDSSPQNWLQIDFDVDSETFSQEFRLNGDAGWGTWIAGIYYLNEDLTQDQSADIFRDLRPITGWDPDNFVIFSNHYHVQETTAWAAFGQVEFDLTEQLTLIGGLRYTNEKKDFSADVRLVEPDFEVPVVDYEDSISEDNVSGKLGLNFRPTDEWLLYASVTTGFKSGGFPGVFGFSEEEYGPYDSETLISYEAGFKSSLADGKAQLNASFFYYDYEDLQLFQLFEGGTIPVQRLTNAANAKVSGIELELQANPVDGLFLLAGLGYADTELKDFEPQPGVDLSGNQLASAPEWTANLLARYDWYTSNGTFYVQGDVVWQDDVFFDALNTPVATQDAYAVVGARAGYISPNDRWDVALWGRNLTEEDYFAFKLDIPDFGLMQGVPGSPRSYGATFTFRLN